ncbi:class II aldolase/adducin N-terminal [Pyronema omphalodes]|nr:class II aldolase/adducin N-terminal [Pyronema omphalodes]
MAPSHIHTITASPVTITVSNEPVKSTKPEQSEASVETKPEAPKKSALELISHGGPILEVPRFVSFDEHRKHILHHMAGYAEGMSGHISVRDPEFPDRFWTNPLGRHFGLLKPSDMVLLDEHGTVVGGNRSRPANAAGFFIHAAIHKARPDVNAAAHMHSTYGRAWSVFGKKLEMLTQDACMFYGEAQGLYDAFQGVVFTVEEGKRLAAALGPRGKGLILRNHGLLTVGSTVDEAAFLFCSMDTACNIQLQADATGREKHVIPDDEAQKVFEETSQADSLYWEFQPDLEYEEAMQQGGDF